ncbi:MFS transporter [Streptomyces sp. RY43-2]|uniref:MFS transporter n=1 Tax=Streptomyces macrolidinus TaxID=2952607 RepID=A0ABT0ZMC0_9ACTN|nr:MFS transporter [Streptomyces macrolidinus]MCN9244726.1 MFS transporter [Streptomyces macrolidinus]
MTDGAAPERAPRSAPEQAARPAPVRGFYAVGLCDAVGLGMYLSLSVLFLDRAADLTNHQIGLVLGASGVASLVGAMPIARAAERFGIRAVLCALFLVRCAAFLALAAVTTFAEALCAAAVAGLLSRGIGPLIESGLINRVPDAQAVGALARVRTLRNVGLAAGALPSGAAIAIDEPWAYRAVLVASAVLFLCCAAICRGFPDTAASASARPGGRARILRNRAFLSITALYGALTLSALLLGIGMPLWIVQRTQAPSWSVTLIQLLNTALVVLLQVRLSKGSERLTRARALMCGGGLLAGFGALTAPLTGLGGGRLDLAVVVVAAVLLSLGEVLITVGTTGAALLHIPEGQKTSHLAALNLGFAVTTIVGPPLISTSVGWDWAGWAGWAAFFTVLGLLALRVPGPSAATASARLPAATATV